MKNLVAKLLCSGILLNAEPVCAAESEQVGPVGLAGESRVMLFSSLEGGKASTAVFDLFSAVAVELRNGRKFSLVSFDEIERGGRGGEKLAIGHIPFILRSELVSAHRVADKTDYDASFKSEDNHILPTVQETLETLVASAAIIVDCKPIESIVRAGAEEKVSACGIYYYSRARGQIVASSKKAFLNGISAPGAWAGELVAMMERGLAAKEKSETANRLQKIMAKDEERATPRQWFAGLGGFAGKQSANGMGANVVAGPEISVGLESASESVGLALRSASSTSSSNQLSELSGGEQGQMKMEMNVIGVTAGVQADALEVMRWHLATTVGIAARTAVVSTSDGQKIAELRGEQAVIEIRPAVGWLLGKNGEFTMGLGYDWFFGGSTRNESGAGFKAASQLMPTDFESGHWSGGVGFKYSFK